LLRGFCIHRIRISVAVSADPDAHAGSAEADAAALFIAAPLDVALARRVAIGVANDDASFAAFAPAAAVFVADCESAQGSGWCRYPQ
jgi:hypothetical protein